MKGRFDQIPHKVGFVDIDGEKKQIGIGDIKEFDDYIEVETLGGCSKNALLEVMHQIANKSRKTVKALFQNEQIVIEPEKLEK